MFEIFFVALAVVGALIAGVTDLRSRTIPNKLSFGLLGIGLVGNTVYGLFTGDYSLVFDLAVGVLFIFAIGYTAWRMAGWAAGDVKEFLFLAALIPRYPLFLSAYTNPHLASYPFPLTLLVNTLVLLFPLTMLYAFAISYRKLTLSEFLSPLRNYKKYAKDAIFVVSSLSFALALERPYLSIIALAAFYTSLIKDVYKYSIAAIVILFFVDGDWQRFSNLFRYFVSVAVFFGLVGAFWNFIIVLRKKALNETRRISDLHEGDIIGEEIYSQDGEVRRDVRSELDKYLARVQNVTANWMSSRPMTLSSLKRAMAEEREARKKRTKIAYPTAGGLSLEEVSELKKHVLEGKLEDKIMVKRGMPFGLAVPLGLLSALIIGDIVVVLR